MTMRPFLIPLLWLLTAASLHAATGSAETGDVTVDTRSDNADLSGLTISSGTLSPAFDAGTTAYALTMPISTTSFTLTPTAGDANATIEIRVNGGAYTPVTSGGTSGAVALVPGVNTVEIRVAAQAGNTITYTITVTRRSAPILTAPTWSHLVEAGATLGGTVNLDAGGAISERGVVYSATATNPNPAIGGAGVTTIAVAGTTGSFSVPVTGLAGGTTYSFRAYATNIEGTTYTSLASFTTPRTGGGATLDITAFGAVAGDGISDYDALNNAINASQAGDTIVIPAGVFSLHRHVSPKDGTRIVGAGMDATTIEFRYTGTTERRMFRIADPGRRRNIELSDFTLDGLSGAFASVGDEPIVISTGTGIVLQRLRVRDFTASSGTALLHGVRITDDSVEWHCFKQLCGNVRGVGFRRSPRERL